MRAWPAPQLPTLPVAGPPVALHDTPSGGLVTTSPDGPARLYVCGITPYDATHLGHANTYVAFDLLNRAWRNAGHEVVFVQNVTDVDDTLLERAAKVHVDWVELAERETELFRQDMAALRVLPPDHYVGAVESIPLVIELIRRLEDAGSIYRVEDDLYFSVTADPAFGAESGWSRERMLEVYPERGGDPDRPGKKDPLDCVVWRGEREGEPSWESPWGRGRPGWHVECTAIIWTAAWGSEVSARPSVPSEAATHRSTAATARGASRSAASASRTSATTGAAGAPAPSDRARRQRSRSSRAVHSSSSSHSQSAR